MFDLSNYSDEQRQAIQTNDKHLRIIACAGSGKTTTVAGKVAYLLEPANEFGLTPKNIIAFTYTEKAAAELKHKILSHTGHLQGMANMFIGTIHGWCLRELQDNEYEYQNFGVLDEIKLKLFIDKYYEQIGMKDVSKLSNPAIPLRRFVDTSLFVRIMDIIRESDLAVGAELPINLRLAFAKYESTLMSKKYFDFSMIMDKALSSLSPESNMTLQIRNNLKYLIVDEFQDINPIQEKLINRLYEISGCKIIVVGDDDQNIYQWRGSNNKYIIDFHNKFPKDDFENIPLEVNYRSSEGITRLAESLISNNKIRIPEKKMESAKRQIFTKGEDILYNEYDNVPDENDAIALYIQNILGVEFSDGVDFSGLEEQTRGLAYSDICILLRTWSKAKSIVEVLDRHGIPYVTAGVNQLFDTPEVVAALGIFNFIYDELSETELEKLWLGLMPYNKIDESKLKVAIEALKARHPKLYEVDKNWEYSLQDIFWDFLENSEIYEETFIDYSSEFSEKRTKERAEILFFNLGKFSQVLNDFEEVNFNSSSPSFHLFNFLSFITYAARDYYPEGWLNNPYKTPNAVQIMTIHQAKGLEFPVVLIPGLNRNYLPKSRKGGLSEWHFLDRALIKEQARYEREENNEDERRLMYVAMTRSQKFLFLSRAPDISNKLYRQESIFIQEMQKANVLVQDKQQAFKNLSRKESIAKEKIKNITLDFTTLKDIFDCPYRFKLVTVYGFKFPLNQRMGMGRSFHNCLMELHKRAFKGEAIDQQKVGEIIENQIHFPYLTSKKLKDSMPENIKNSVLEYYNENKNTFNEIVFVEQDIQYKLSDNILVLGRVDLIKKRNESGKYETIIIEFKSKEEKEISRLTKDQLKLYALGHRELTGETADYIMTYYIGDNIAKTPERLHENDLSDIESKIHEAVRLIRASSFIKVENEDKCKFCHQNSLCPHRIRYNLKNLRK